MACAIEISAAHKFFASVFRHTESATVANLGNIVENKRIQFVNKTQKTTQHSQNATDIPRIMRSKRINSLSRPDC